jgi:hypothetical protein
MTIQRFLLFSVITFLGLLPLLCSAPQMAGGTDTETGGTVIIGYINKSDNTPAPNTVVSLIPTNYDPAADSSTPAFITDTTNADGSYTIQVPARGKYNIMAVNMGSRSRLLLYGIDCANDVVHAPTGALSMPGFVRLLLPDSIDAMKGCFSIRGTNLLAWPRTKTNCILIDSVPVGVIPSIRYTSLNSSTSSVIQNNISVNSGDTTTLVVPSFQFSKRIVLNTSASGADVSGDVTQFPVLIRLNSGNFNFSQAKPDGADIRFATAGNTPLPYEILHWDSGNRTARIWVRVDTIRGGDSVQSIIMYWGNGAARDSSSSANVFDTAVGFQGVWHLNEEGNDPALDATANHYDGTACRMAGAPPASGPIGNGRPFDGESSFITMPNTASGKLSFPGNGYFTVSAWVYADTVGNGFRAIVAKGFQQYMLWLTYFPLGKPRWEFIDYGLTENLHMSTSTALERQWVLLTGVRAGNSQYLYCNGELVATRTMFLPQTFSRDTTNDLAIGRFLKEAAYSFWFGYGFFKGSIAEVRICNTARNAHWERLAYMNQRNDDKLVQVK